MNLAAESQSELSFSSLVAAALFYRFIVRYHARKNNIISYWNGLELFVFLVFFFLWRKCSSRQSSLKGQKWSTAFVDQ